MGYDVSKHDWRGTCRIVFLVAALLIVGGPTGVFLIGGFMPSLNMIAILIQGFGVALFRGTNPVARKIFNQGKEHCNVHGCRHIRVSALTAYARTTAQALRPSSR